MEAISTYCIILKTTDNNISRNWAYFPASAVSRCLISLSFKLKLKLLTIERFQVQVFIKNATSEHLIRTFCSVLLYLNNAMLCTSPIWHLNVLLRLHYSELCHYFIRCCERAIKFSMLNFKFKCNFSCTKNHLSFHHELFTSYIKTQ